MWCLLLGIVEWCNLLDCSSIVVSLLPAGRAVIIDGGLGGKYI